MLACVTFEYVERLKGCEQEESGVPLRLTSTVLRFFPVFQWHGDPPDTCWSELLVRSNDCKNQAFSYWSSLGWNFIWKRADERWDELERVGKTMQQIINECEVN